MKAILLDLSDEQFAQCYGDRFEDAEIISDTGTIRYCIRFFKCWVKTPRTCILKDGYQHMGKLLSQCDQIMIIIRCLYGSYSPFVCNVLFEVFPTCFPISWPRTEKPIIASVTRTN